MSHMGCGEVDVLNAAPAYSSRWLFVACCRLNMGLQQPICHVVSLQCLSYSTCCQKDPDMQGSFNSMCFCLERTACYTHNIAHIRFREWTVKRKMRVQLFFCSQNLVASFSLDKHGFYTFERHKYRCIYQWCMCSQIFTNTIWENSPQMVMVFRKPCFFRRLWM